jgi:hypothetical protein
MAVSPKSLANLHPGAAPDGGSHNKKGVNAFSEVHAELVKFLRDPDTEFDRSDRTRVQALMSCAFVSGMIDGKDGAPDRHWLLNQVVGKPRERIDLSSEDGSMSPLGPDSVADALRVAIEERRKLKQKPPEEPAKQEAPGDDTAGAK